jgi:transposase
MYSKEMRRDVLAACDLGAGTKAVALRFKVSESWVRRVKQEFRESGKTAPCTQRKRVPEWAKHAEQIHTLYSQQADLTLRELQEALGTELSLPTLCNALRVLKLTLKKSNLRRRTRSPRCSTTSRRVGLETSGTRSRKTRVSR